MGNNNKQALIVYSSPAGTIRHVAQVIMKTLDSLGYKHRVSDLGKRDDHSKLNSQIKDLVNGGCLWIGSPVYAGHAVPPITDFISQLPVSKGGYAVPFVTWGGVSSGVALHEMGKMLGEKGYIVLGAAKVLAVHSMMWQFQNPLGEGHPDSEDDVMIKGLVGEVNSKLLSDAKKAIPLENLNYQPKEVQEAMKKVNIEMAKQMLPPRQLDEEACTKCGVCEEECPAQAIKCDPYPKFGDACFVCYNCVRLCEEGAIKTDLSQIEGMLKERAAKNSERPLSQVFV
ncbi:MAG: EFR1 family ferrodoxin [Deltaproteobacteria bacterium]|nr:EFR1 family ferrodoxin [Deltaproteobacteria bacterium]